MQTQNQLAQQNKSAPSLKEAFAVSTSITPKQKADVVEFYGENFWADLAPKFPSLNRESTYPSLQSAIEDLSAPTLVTIDKVYVRKGNGEPPSVEWLRIQIVELLIYTGLREKMTEAQQYALARQLRKMGYYVRLSEMMMFFTRFEQGYYKTFQGYERPNPQIVTQSFLDFLDDLEDARGVYYEKERQRKQAEEYQDTLKNAVSYEEHLKMHQDKLDKLYNHTNANVQLSKSKSQSTEESPAP